MSLGFQIPLILWNSQPFFLLLIGHNKNDQSLRASASSVTQRERERFPAKTLGGKGLLYLA